MKRKSDWFESSWRDLQDLLNTVRHFCTFWIQSGNHEERFWQASSGRKTQPRKKNSRPKQCSEVRELEKRRCTRHSALTRRVGTAQIHRSEFKNPTKFRQAFSHICNSFSIFHFFCKLSLMISKFHQCRCFFQGSAILTGNINIS